MKQLLGIALLAGALAAAPGIAGAASVHKTGKKHGGTKHAASGTTRPAPSDAMKPAK